MQGAYKMCTVIKDIINQFYKRRVFLEYMIVVSASA